MKYNLEFQVNFQVKFQVKRMKNRFFVHIRVTRIENLRSIRKQMSYGREKVCSCTVRFVSCGDNHWWQHYRNFDF